MTDFIRRMIELERWLRENHPWAYLRLWIACAMLGLSMAGMVRSGHPTAAAFIFAMGVLLIGTTSWFWRD